MESGQGRGVSGEDERAKAPATSAVAQVAVLLVGCLFSAAGQASPAISIRHSPATAGRRPTSARVAAGDSDGASSRTARSSRSGAAAPAAPRLRPRPLQPERHARHELLRRRQADDRLRGLDDAASGVALQADGKIVAVGSATARRRLRPRPLQPQRLARHDLLRRRQADHRLRGLGDGATGVAIQANGKIVAVGGRPGSGHGRRLRPRPLQPQRLARHELLRRRQADDRLRGQRDEANGVAIQADGKIVAVGRAIGHHRRLRPRPLQPERLARPELLGRRQADDRLRAAATRRSAVALQADGKIVAVGDAGRLRRQRLRARPLQPERHARHELLGRRQADDRLRRRLRRGERGGDPGRRQDRRGRQRRRPRRRLRPRPLQPERLARHELLGRRQADDRLRGRRRGERGGAPGETARSSRSARHGR